MDSYHGTSSKYINDLVSGNIDLSSGGGELGQGFYTGQYIHDAKVWAYNKHHRSKSVLSLDVPDSEVESLNIEILDHKQASSLRSLIKLKNATRNYMVGADLVWAPIVGTSRISGDQYKWESEDASTLLNGNKVTRNEI